MWLFINSISINNLDVGSAAAGEKQTLVTPPSEPPVAGPSRRSRSPTPARTPGPRCSRSSLPPVQPSPEPAFPDPSSAPLLATPPRWHDVSIGMTPKPSRKFQDVGIGMTPRPSRTFQDVIVGMTPVETSGFPLEAGISAEALSEDEFPITATELGRIGESGIIFDGGIGAEALSEDEFPITASELGRIGELGIIFDGGIGAEALSEDEFEIVPDSELARIEAGNGPEALANLSQALSERDVEFVLPDSDPRLKSSKTQTSNLQPSNPQLQSPQPQSPQPSPSPPPQPQTLFHIYAGAFPSQEVAMNNGYYTDSISISIVEDPWWAAECTEDEGEDYRMVKSDGIPSTWMNSFESRSTNPQARMQNACWEWVGHLGASCRHLAVANRF